MKHLLSFDFRKSVFNRKCKLLSVFLLMFVPVIQAEILSDPLEPIITMKTEKLAGEEITFVLDPLEGEPASIQIDWGNGVLSKEQTGSRDISGNLPFDGATIKIYGNAENIAQITCSKNALSALNVQKLVRLENLFCDDNVLTELDVKSLVNLKQLTCQKNKLKALDVTTLAQLTRFYCFENELNALDISKCLQLTQFDCSTNKLTSLILKGAMSLDKLTFSDNLLTSIDLSGLVNVTTLRCENNLFTTLDLTPLTSMTIVYCRNNLNLTEMIVKDHKALKSIYVTNAALASLDISGVSAITRLECENNNLASLTMQGNSALTRVLCENNYLKFSTLPYPAFSSKYTFAPQKLMKLTDRQYYVNEEIDLSSQYKVNKGTEEILTLFVWKKKDGTVLSAGTDYMADGGVFKFNVVDSVYCEMTNSVFPGLILKTENLAIVEEKIPDPIFEITTTKSAEEDFVFTLVASDEEPASIQIDWGNGILTQNRTGNNEITGKVVVDNATIKIYGNAELMKELKCSGNKISSLNIGQLVNLENLVCNENIITSLSLAPFNNLKNLSCRENKFTFLDLSSLLKLETLNCAENELTSLDISKNVTLLTLDCSKNKMTSLVLNGAINVAEVYFSDNLLPTIDLSGLTKITELHCENNLLTTLDLTQLTSLTAAYCKNNGSLANVQVKNHPALKSLFVNSCNLTKLDASGIESLIQLECDQNKLDSLIIERNPALETVLCNDNNLMISNLPYPSFKTNYIYAPQREMKMVSKHYFSNEEVDLSAQYKILRDGQADAITVFTWKKEDGASLISGTDYMHNEGKFTFNKVDSIYCEMVNPLFPELVLKTDKIHIEEASLIKNNQNQITGKVYVDPVTNELILEGFENVSGVSVYDLTGGKLKTSLCNLLPDMSGCLPGVYLVHVNDQYGSHTYKVILK